MTPVSPPHRTRHHPALAPHDGEGVHSSTLLMSSLSLILLSLFVYLHSVRKPDISRQTAVKRSVAAEFPRPPKLWWVYTSSEAPPLAPLSGGFSEESVQTLVSLGMTLAPDGSLLIESQLVFAPDEEEKLLPLGMKLLDTLSALSHSEGLLLRVSGPQESLLRTIKQSSALRRFLTATVTVEVGVGAPQLTVYRGRTP